MNSADELEALVFNLAYHLDIAVSAEILDELLAPALEAIENGEDMSFDQFMDFVRDAEIFEKCSYGK